MIDQLPVKARLKVTGQVQGVFYRQSTQRKARSLGVQGWVRNLGDGSVEIEAQGTGSAVDQLISWCRLGPPQAQVLDVEIQFRQEIAALGSIDFEIR